MQVATASHVFVGAGAKLRQTVDFHRAGVGDQNQLGALKHQQARAFGEFPVIADHRADMHRAAGRVQRDDGEAVPPGVRERSTSKSQVCTFA